MIFIEGDCLNGRNGFALRFDQAIAQGTGLPVRMMSPRRPWLRERD